MQVLTPIGKVCEPKSIEELCYESTQHILNTAQDKRIYISWSGGIDSTLVLAEFLKEVPADRITVLMNKYSIEEYPEFYNAYIKDKLHVKEFSFNDNRHLLDSIKDGVVVTGDCLDTVFGINQYDSIPKDRLFQSIPDFLTKVTKQSREIYEKLIAACPRKLENVKDLLWWMEYTLNYQCEQLAWVVETENVNIGENLFHFGATAGWNDYAVSTPCEIKYQGHDFRNYKMPLKQQLFKFTKDSYYTQHKVKYPSWRKYRNELQIMKNKAVYINTDWKRSWSILKTSN